MAEKITVILSRQRDSQVEPRKFEDAIIAALAHRPDIALTVVPHLYDLADDGPIFTWLRSLPDDLIVLSWLYPRAAYWVLGAHQVAGRMGPTFSLNPGDVDAPDQSPQRTIWCFDLRTFDRPEPYVQQIGRLASLSVEPAVAHVAQAAPTELAEAVRGRWYPVVDRSRCESCMECLNFCLFGVYGLNGAGNVFVEQPDACRPGCPACSRICPSGAIMFPEHDDPAIAGDAQTALPQKLDPAMVRAGLISIDLASKGRALEERRMHHAKSAPPPEPASDQMDRLVDEVDRLDL